MEADSMRLLEVGSLELLKVDSLVAAMLLLQLPNDCEGGRLLFEVGRV